MTQDNQTTQVLRYRLAWQEWKKTITKDRKTKKEKTTTHLYRRFSDSSSVDLEGVPGLLDYCDKYNKNNSLSEVSVEVFRTRKEVKEKNSEA